MTGYYDYVLGLIPGAFVGITALLGVAGVDRVVAMPVGAAVAAVIAVHALFVNGPVTTDRETTGAATDHAPMNAD